MLRSLENHFESPNWQLEMKTMAEDYYKVLGVERNASSDEITKAYRKLARKHHPDLNPDDKSAKKRFQEIQSAYDCLNDPDKRAKYDQFGANYEQFAGGAGPGPFGVGVRALTLGTYLVEAKSTLAAFSGTWVVVLDPEEHREAPTFPQRFPSRFGR